MSHQDESTSVHCLGCDKHTQTGQAAQRARKYAETQDESLFTSNSSPQVTTCELGVWDLLHNLNLRDVAKTCHQLSPTRDFPR